MSARNFHELLEARWRDGKFVCVGLDSDHARLPLSVGKATSSAAQVAFNKAIVDKVKDLVCAFKINIAFYEELVVPGIYNLKATIGYILDVAPDIPVILDAKRADVGNSNAAYVRTVFEGLRADAVTVNPYFGSEALLPFLDCKDKGIIVLCRTSNQGAGEFQDLHTLTLDPRSKPKDIPAETWLETLCADSMQLYERVAFNVANKWNKNGNCLLAVGATFPLEAKRIRKQVGDVPFLLPGIGTQGGDIEATVLASRDSRGLGMIINASSSIIFASRDDDFIEAARKKTEELHKLITRTRQKGNTI